MIGVDLDRSAAPYLELEEVAQVVGRRLHQRLEGDGVLAGLTDVSEVDVIRRKSCEASGLQCGEAP